MSRSATRARRRRAHFVEQIETLLAREATATSAQERIAASGDLVKLLKRIADSELRLWSFRAQLLGMVERGRYSREDADATKAMLAQLVAGHLAGQTPGSVYNRLKLGG
jgi:hypothetical protein